MRIRVEERHIYAGKRGSAMLCPVARALEDAGLRGAEVFTSDLDMQNWTAWYKRDGHWRRARLSRAVGRRIDAYDAGATMAPFVFILREVATV